ncbi:MAG TPA: hypothetical protein VLF09_07550 [Cellvibrio sp.]|nr:hypothetical protein [Cellvibrio sp.]
MKNCSVMGRFGLASLPDAINCDELGGYFFTGSARWAKMPTHFVPSDGGWNPTTQKPI